MYQIRYEDYSDWLDSYYEQLRASAREAFLKRRFCRNLSRKVSVLITSPIVLGQLPTVSGNWGRAIGYQEGTPP